MNRHESTHRSLSMLTASVVLCAAVLLVGGCVTTTPQPVVVAAPAAADVAELRQAQETAARALEAERAATAAKAAAEAERLGKLKANVTAAHAAVDLDQKPVAQGELTIAESRLADVQPDPAEVAEAARRRALVISGQLDEAQAAYRYASAAAEAKTAAIARLEQERDAAQAAANAAGAEASRVREEMLANAEATRAANQRKIDEALRYQRDSIVRRQTELLNWIGTGSAAAALVVLAIGWLLGGLAGLQKTWPVALMCAAGAACCFEGAQLLGVPWLKWVLGGTILAAVGIWFWRTCWLHEKAEKASAAAAQAQAEATRYLAFAKAIIPVLDARYEDGSESDRQWMDVNIFDQLSVTEDAATKAMVHDIRARLALSATTATQAQ